MALAYYDKDPAALDTTKVMVDLQAQYSSFRYVEDTYFQLSFGHLDGYSAMYCTYMCRWSSPRIYSVSSSKTACSTGKRPSAIAPWFWRPAARGTRRRWCETFSGEITPSMPLRVG